MEKNLSISGFEIKGLFKRKNVDIKFNERQHVDIFIGQNGIGKTTILNILYFTLSLNFSELRKIQFNSIKITLSNGKEALLEREQLFLTSEGSNRIATGALKEIEEYMGKEFRHNLHLSSRNNDHIETLALLEKVYASKEIPSILRSYVGRKIEGYEVTNNVKTMIETINELNLEEIFFFPTYRRIEDDFKKFKLSEVELNKLPGDIINFGMGDVLQKFEDIEKVISKAINDTYSNLTGEMISYLSTNENSISRERKSKIEDIQTVEIILSRLANKLSKDVVDNVIELFSDKENIYNKRYEPLVFFLCALIDKYEDNMLMEESILKFKTVVNKYLVNKSIVYDQHNIRIYVQDNETEEEIELTLLSSGEKQIISLFSKLYLSFKEFIVLFDEPELSLSIEWQETLIRDIMKSEKCRFLIAVTHSPFIFNNEYEESARSMDLFVSNHLNVADEDDLYDEH